MTGLSFTAAAGGELFSELDGSPSADDGTDSFRIHWYLKLSGRG